MIEEILLKREKEIEELGNKLAPLSRIILTLVGHHRVIRIKVDDVYTDIRCDVVYDGYICELEDGVPSNKKRVSLDNIAKRFLYS